MLTPEGSSQGHEKKKSKLKMITSTIRNVFELSKERKDLGQEPKFGLLKFFSKGTVEDKKAYFARENEQAENMQSLNNVEVQNLQMEKKQHERELAFPLQSLPTKKIKETEIKAKVRAVKQKLIEMELKDSTDPSLKKIKGNIVELTQPVRDVKGKIHAQNRKPQGQKQKNKPQAAKYHNWLTPFCWTQIVIVAKQVGQLMGASDIAMHLKKRDPVTFGQISHNTIEGWIDCSSGNPCWKDSVL
ncbi:hypothetical protein L208DRAFT_1268982 [Tricholoma matsutake]|nr:hypothetical protein L208DRAFT_1268982 [Tricholoma matsutake 945]